MKNNVKIQQIALILLLIIPGGKFLSLPAILAEQIGHDSWLVIAIMLCFDAICLGFLLWAIKMNRTKHLSFNEILVNSVGKVASKIIFIVFFLIFVARVVTLIASCYKLFAVTFTVKTNWPAFIIPIMLVTFFVVSRGFKAIARTNQLLFVLILLSVVSILIFPATQIDFSSLLPIAEAGWGKVFRTVFTNGYWFSDYIFIYFVLGDLNGEKKVFAPVFSCFVVGAVTAVAMNLIFVAMYGDIAKYSDLAMSKISLFSIAESTNGRWDWLSLSVWVMSVLIKIFVFMYSAYKCVEYIFNVNEVKFNYYIAGGISLLMFAPMFVSPEKLLDTFIRAMYYPYMILQYVLPFFMPLLVFLALKKTRGKVIGPVGVNYEKS